MTGGDTGYGDRGDTGYGDRGDTGYGDRGEEKSVKRLVSYDQPFKQTNRDLI